MGIIPIDETGKVLHDNITWVDGRAEKQAQWLMKRFLGKAVFKAIVGIEITGKDVVPKLIWLKEKLPDVYAKTHKVLDVNGYLKFRATDKAVAEWSGACSYAFDLKKKDWERIFFRRAGLDLTKLPDLIRSVDRVGELTEKAAEELGLKPNIPVYGGCDDTQSAAMGSGANEEGEGHIYLGTSAWVGVSSAKAPKFKNGAVCLQSADPERNLIVGITESAGANVDWLIDSLYSHEKTIDPTTIFALMSKEVDAIPPGSDHLVFTPWLLGERCPVSTTTTRGTLFNLGHEHSRGHIMRAHLEGIAYNLRWTIENMEKDFGFRLSSLRVTGGGSQNGEWMQVIADITGREIVTTDQPKMAGALGVAMCVFVGSKTFESFGKVKELVTAKQAFRPDTKNKAIYDKLFTDYQSLYHALKKTYIQANAQRFSQKETS